MYRSSPSVGIDIRDVRVLRVRSQEVWIQGSKVRAWPLLLEL